MCAWMEMRATASATATDGRGVRSYSIEERATGKKDEKLNAPSQQRRKSQRAGESTWLFTRIRLLYLDEL